MPDDVDLRIAGPLACGVQTGAGTVLDVLRVPPGSSIAVFGAGSVGLCGIMAARLAGATTIIAVNRRASRLALAAEFGATHLSPRRTSTRWRRSETRPAGAGWSSPSRRPASPEVLTPAVRSLDSLGTCAYVGTAAPGELGGIPMLEAMTKGLDRARRPAGRQHPGRPSRGCGTCTGGGLLPSTG